MSTSSRFAMMLLCACASGWTQQTVTVGQGGAVVPAGTLLGCILDEPNFSSQTAQANDPILCKTTSVVEMFGRSLIPRGAYLSARLRNYRDPGRLVGKGWLKLEFTSLTMPGGSVAVDAKVISAARYRVNGDGKIQGAGHATRDAVEWAIPILWPIKVVTLPARGPRPTLKGETRIGLRLMEDLLIPESAYATPGFLTQRSSARQIGPRDGGANTFGARLAEFRSDPNQPTEPGSAIDRYRTMPATNPAAQSRLTLLALRGGRMYLVTDYWMENGKLNYATGGAVHSVRLDGVDIPLTRQLNAERGVPFMFAARNH